MFSYRFYIPSSQVNWNGGDFDTLQGYGINFVQGNSYNVFVMERGEDSYIANTGWVATHNPMAMKLQAIDLALAGIILNATTEGYQAFDVGRTFQVVHSITNQITSVMLTNNSDTCFFKLVKTK